jgi:hypothetical protein
MTPERLMRRRNPAAHREGRRTMSPLSNTRLIGFGSASAQTLGHQTGEIPETDFGVYPAEA